MDLARHVLLLASAALPTLILLAALSLLDSERTPRRALSTTFMLGLATAAPLLVYLAVVRPWFDALALHPYMVGLGHAFVLAAAPEEALKFLVLVTYARGRGGLDAPAAGLRHGVFASLGLATVENMVYVSAGGFAVALSRATSAVLCHAALGALMGVCLARARERPTAGRYACALVIPVVLHGLYDFPLMTLKTLGTAATSGERWAMTSLVYVVLGGTIVWASWLWYRWVVLRRPAKQPG